MEIVEMESPCVETMTGNKGQAHKICLDTGTTLGRTKSSWSYN